jgi:hypothetical protein
VREQERESVSEVNELTRQGRPAGTQRTLLADVSCAGRQRARGPREPSINAGKVGLALVPRVGLCRRRTEQITSDSSRQHTARNSTHIDGE